MFVSSLGSLAAAPLMWGAYSSCHTESRPLAFGSALAGSSGLLERFLWAALRVHDMRSGPLREKGQLTLSLCIEPLLQSQWKLLLLRCLPELPSLCTHMLGLVPCTPSYGSGSALWLREPSETPLSCRQPETKNFCLCSFLTPTSSFSYIFSAPTCVSIGLIFPGNFFFKRECVYSLR